MALQKSEQYEAQINTSRLFKSLIEDVQDVQRHADQIVGAANAMRHSLGRALLGLAQVEALYVAQTESNRKANSELHDTLLKVQQLTHNLKDKEIITAGVVKSSKRAVDAIAEQTQRIETDRFHRPEPTVPEGEQVGAEYICNALGITDRTFRRYRDAGHIDAPTATVPCDRGPPRQVWNKTTADLFIAEINDMRQIRTTAVR